MISREFYKLSNELMKPLLSPYGFTNNTSKKSVFHRQVSDDIYHFIVPWLMGRGGTRFEIKVLATSPLIDPRFSDRFPDHLSMPDDRKTDLDPVKGVTFRASHTYRGNKKEGFVRNFNNQAKPAIIKYAIPHLDKIQTLKQLRSNMTPTLNPTSGLSYALIYWQTGKKRKGKRLLLAHREHLLGLIAGLKTLEPENKVDANRHNQSISQYTASIEYVEQLLNF